MRHKIVEGDADDWRLDDGGKEFPVCEASSQHGSSNVDAVGADEREGKCPDHRADERRPHEQSERVISWINKLLRVREA